MEKRRFSRICLSEKSFVEYGDNTMAVELMDISLKGALLRFDQPVACRQGDNWRLSFNLGGSDIVMKFKAEVVHVRIDLVGVKFVETDLDTMIHLRNLMEARTMDHEQVRHELDFLIDSD